MVCLVITRMDCEFELEEHQSGLFGYNQDGL